MKFGSWDEYTKSCGFGLATNQRVLYRWGVNKGFMMSQEKPAKAFKKPLLPIRLRKLIGFVLILVLLFFYALIVMRFAVSTNIPESGVKQFFFYLVMGMAWIIPAGAIIYWMERPDTPPK
jgi:hypothetical protein